MSEAVIQAEILLAIGQTPGLFIWRQNVGKMKTASGRVVSFGIPGCPDIIGCYRGRFIGIEVKTANGKQRVAQLDFQRILEKAGGIYIVARSSVDAKSALEAIQ